MNNQWLPVSEIPDSGDSIWIAVLEWDGKHTHVDYAQTFLYVDGLIVHRYDGDFEIWPPQDVLAWQLCDTPMFTQT